MVENETVGNEIPELGISGGETPVKRGRGRPRKTSPAGDIQAPAPPPSNTGEILNRMVDGFSLSGTDREIARPLLDYAENYIGASMIALLAGVYFLAKYLFLPWFSGKTKNNNEEKKSEVQQKNE